MKQLVESTLTEHDNKYVRTTWPTHCAMVLKSKDFTIGIYPDTAKSKLGQKRQILKLSRIITPLLEKHKFKRQHYREYGVWEDGWKERSLDYHLVGPTVDHVAYIRKSRPRNRPGFITDTMIDISIEYNHTWWDADKNVIPMANLIIEELKKCCSK